jgi:hypothetical protein
MLRDKMVTARLYFYEVWGNVNILKELNINKNNN